MGSSGSPQNSTCASVRHRKLFPIAILAGGLANRLRPLTEAIPKAMIRVNGEPFIAHQLRLLRDRGIERVVLCLGFKSEIIQGYVRDGASFGLEVAYSMDGPTLLGTGGALKRAIPLLGDHFFVLYGDSYLTCDYAAIQHHFLEARKLGLMTVFRNDNLLDTSNVEFSEGEIRAYSKEVPTPQMKYIDYGLGVFHVSAFAGVAADIPCDLARIYQEMLVSGDLAGFVVHERFYEVGSLTGIRDLSNYLATQRQGRVT
jgi:NDP-sugar pyrophosphorylase family protein